ncbi:MULTISPECIES: SAM-dependent methyltransferase [unclassified Sphingomonas]|uniref:SAM-dependent methyltransferase n=1 Tax=unclassified Sphingomonas TaxID=196159 RepID=UPI000834AAF6|nr:MULTISPECIES: methyltransferase domain-containing protein [unclassified Sphingomonas]
MSCFAQDMACVVAALPGSLAGPAARGTLEALTQTLPPFHSGGFECRLGAVSGSVELQLCMRRDRHMRDRQLPPLIHALRTATPPVDATLIDFLERWTLGHGPSQELWLEFDPSPLGWRPSLFVDLPRRAGNHRLACSEALEQIADIAGPDGAKRSADAVTRCIMALPDGAYPSHLGLMFGRENGGIRLNLKRSRPDTIDPFLDRAGWPGDRSAVAETIGVLPTATRFTIALDLDAQLQPGIGIECAAPGVHAHGADAWRPLLAALIDAGLCTPQAMAGLLDWPRQITPANTPLFPPELLLNSLTGPIDSLTTLLLGISHIKIGIAADGDRTGKGYLWFGEQLFSPVAQGAVDARIDALRQDRRPMAERATTFFACTTDLFVDYLGSCFQAWLIDADGDVAASNRALAKRAGLRDGWRVLDAGCGVGGPAIDIAGAIDVTIMGVTICPRQVELATGFVADAGLADRIDIQCGDYHRVAAPDGSFDAVLFLESSNHSEDPVALFAEMARLLRPGGHLYIVDTIIADRDTLTGEERTAVELFDLVHCDRTRSLAETCAALSAAGFEIVRAADISDEVSARRWEEAIWQEAINMRAHTPFGAAHDVPLLNRAPGTIRCGEILAIRRAT